MPATLSGTGHSDDDTVAWLPRTGRARGRRQSRHRNPARLAGTLALGLALAAGLPQAASAPAFLAPLLAPLSAPAAQAHGRIDASPQAARALAEAAPSVSPAAWDGLPLPEQDPPTAALIADDLAALPRVTPGEDGDAVRFGARRVPRKVVDTILQASDEAGVDPVYMMALADKESSFDTDARAATSSAQGLFQFVSGTWLEMIRDFGARYGLGEEAAAVKGRGPGITVAKGMRGRVLALRNDPRVAALMAAELIKRDRGRIESRVGRTLSTTELYFAHFLGTADAGRFLSLSSAQPDTTAARAFGSAARANRSLFTQRDGAKRRAITVAELHERVGGMIDSRLSRYRGVAAIAAVPEVISDGAATARVAAPAEPAAAPPRRIEVTEALPPGDE